MRHSLQFLGFGLVFGFLLSRVGATDFDAIAKMFLLTDLHLMGVIGVAVIVAGIGGRSLRARSEAGHSMPMFSAKPVKPGLVLGSVLFGLGWATTGTCPGTGLAQIGEGKWLALFTVTGVFAGTGLYHVLGASIERRLAALQHSQNHRPVHTDSGTCGVP